MTKSEGSDYRGDPMEVDAIGKGKWKNYGKGKGKQPKGKGKGHNHYDHGKNNDSTGSKSSGGKGQDYKQGKAARWCSNCKSTTHDSDYCWKGKGKGKITKRGKGVRSVETEGEDYDGWEGYEDYDHYEGLQRKCNQQLQKLKLALSVLPLNPDAQLVIEVLTIKIMARTTTSYQSLMPSEALRLLV